jgi:hypothetical protein
MYRKKKNKLMKKQKSMHRNTRKKINYTLEAKRSGNSLTWMKTSLKHLDNKIKISLLEFKKKLYK